jgi:hypothetical protein
LFVVRDQQDFFGRSVWHCVGAAAAVGEGLRHIMKTIYFYHKLNLIEEK